MDYLLGGALGAISAFVFSLPAIVLEWTARGKAEQTPLVIDVRSVFGMTLKRSEVFLVGLFLHLVVGFLFGSTYVLLVDYGWSVSHYQPYSFLSFLMYALLSWVVVNVVLYPLLGMGWFASKEGPTVWLETFVSHVLMGCVLWLLVQYYQPVYFTPVL